MYVSCNRTHHDNQKKGAVMAVRPVAFKESYRKSLHSFIDFSRRLRCHDSYEIPMCKRLSSILNPKP